MRISDWSSDVCSSDLLSIELRGGDGDYRAARKPLDARLSGAPRRGVGNALGARTRRAAHHRLRGRGGAGADRAVSFPQGGSLWRARQCRRDPVDDFRPEEHTSELQSLMRISYAVLCLNKKHTQTQSTTTPYT